MFPRTKLGEKKHRKHKRELEISSTVEKISNFFNDEIKDKKINILEFGCGDGFQIPYLQQIGNVVASDTYASKEIKEMKDVNFIESSITNTPFSARKFDIVFSNHVIEHIEDMHSAFGELKRIGKPDCVYAFSVPTNIWLLLSIPAQYYNKLRTLSRRFLSIFSKSKMNKPAKNNRINKIQKRKEKNIINKLCRIIGPTGHGVYPDFIDCYWSFRIKNWQQLFSDNGFSIIKTQPLLLYAASEWPIIPTTKLFNRLNLCSSVLFLMKKTHENP